MKLGLGKIFGRIPKMPVIKPKVVGVVRPKGPVVNAQYPPKPKAQAAVPRGGTNLVGQGKLGGQARLDQGFTSTRQMNMKGTAKRTQGILSGQARLDQGFTSTRQMNMKGTANRTQKKPLFSLPKMPKMPQLGRRPAYGFSAGYQPVVFSLPPARKERPMLIPSRRYLN